MINGPTEISIECDKCGEEKDFVTTEYAGTPQSWGVDPSTLTEEGWEESSGEHYCPKCIVEKMTEDDEDDDEDEEGEDADDEE
jgi:hypothetical protein